MENNTKTKFSFGAIATLGYLLFFIVISAIYAPDSFMFERGCYTSWFISLLSYIPLAVVITLKKRGAPVLIATVVSIIAETMELLQLVSHYHLSFATFVTHTKDFYLDISLLISLILIAVLSLYDIKKGNSSRLRGIFATSFIAFIVVHTLLTLYFTCANATWRMLAVSNGAWRLDLGYGICHFYTALLPILILLIGLWIINPYQKTKKDGTANNTDSNDNILIKSETNETVKQFLKFCPITCLKITVINCILLIYTKKACHLEYIFGSCPEISLLLLLSAFCLLVTIVVGIIYLVHRKCELQITESTVKGKTLLGKEVTLPLYMVSAYSTRKFLSTICIATASGITKFSLVANYKAIGEVLEQKINERQQDTNATEQSIPITPSTPAAQSALRASLDDLVKLKSLLDAGVITQEEFDAKKKQLLDL